MVKCYDISTGLQTLDKMINGVCKKDLVCLATRPGMGKTSFALGMISHAMQMKKKNVLFFSLEMSKEQIKFRLGKTADGCKRGHLYIMDSPLVAVSDMISKICEIQDIDLVIVDYLQLIRADNATSDRKMQMQMALKSLKIMAIQCNTSVMVLSQLSRAPEARVDHQPHLSDFSDNGMLVKDCDIVLFLYKSDYYLNAPPNTDKTLYKCIVAKNCRGDCGTALLKWDEKALRFYD